MVFGRYLKKTDNPYKDKGMVMAKYILTKRGYESLVASIKYVEQRLSEAIATKSDGGSGQDGWHDEGFKIGVVDETMWSQRLGALEEIYRNAEIVYPREQNDIVDFGVGVVLEDDAGKISKFILEGYNIEGLDGILSASSPLGQAVMGSKKGEKVSFRVGKSEKMVIVKEIVPPSKAEELILPTDFVEGAL
jgi:hypothetical protein